MGGFIPRESVHDFEEPEKQLDKLISCSMHELASRLTCCWPCRERESGGSVGGNRISCDLSRIYFCRTLAGYIQACRGLMIAAVCLGFFGSIFALVGMKCTKIGGSDRNKARIACLAGVNFILSGKQSKTIGESLLTCIYISTLPFSQACAHFRHAPSMRTRSHQSFLTHCLRHRSKSSVTLCEHLLWPKQLRKNIVSVGMNWGPLSSLAGLGLFSVSWVAACSASLS